NSAHITTHSDSPLPSVGSSLLTYTSPRLFAVVHASRYIYLTGILPKLLFVIFFKPYFLMEDCMYFHRRSGSRAERRHYASSCCYCTARIWCRYARQRRDRRLRRRRRRCGCLNYAWTWLTYNVYCLLDDECVQILFYKPSAGNFLYLYTPPPLTPRRRPCCSLYCYNHLTIPSVLHSTLLHTLWSWSPSCWPTITAGSLLPARINSTTYAYFLEFFINPLSRIKQYFDYLKIGRATLHKIELGPPSAIYHKVSKIGYEGSEFSSFNNYDIIVRRESWHSGSRQCCNVYSGPRNRSNTNLSKHGLIYIYISISQSYQMRAQVFFLYLYIRHFLFVNGCTVRFVFLRIISYILSTRNNHMKVLLIESSAVNIALFLFIYIINMYNETATRKTNGSE
ncbi:unnamed protein product, partial [Trichogramma brassicae]